MLIKFKTSIAGNNFSHKPGDVVNWRDANEAQRYIDAGLAEAVQAPSRTTPREEATVQPRIETADLQAAAGGSKPLPDQPKPAVPGRPTSAKGKK